MNRHEGCASDFSLPKNRKTCK